MRHPPNKLESAEDAQRFLGRWELITTVVAAAAIIAWVFLCSFVLVHLFSRLLPEGLDLLVTLLCFTFGTVLVSLGAWRAAWLCLIKLNLSRAYTALFFWIRGSSFTCRDLMESNHPLAGLLIALKPKTSSTIPGLSSNSLAQLENQGAGFAILDALVISQSEREVDFTTGEFTALGSRRFLCAVAQRPKGAPPVRIAGWLPHRAESREQFLATLKKHLQEQERLETELGLDQEADRLLKQLMDAQKLEIYLLARRLDHPHCGIFGTSVYIQQRHRPGAPFKDMVIIEEAPPSLRDYISNYLQTVISGALKIP